MKNFLLVSKLIHPIRISTPFAVGDVFSYLITDQKNVLVDCGYNDKKSLSIISNHLEERDLSLKDIDEIWLTHGHPDHFGLAAKLADHSGAVIYGHPKERANFAGNDDRELFQAFFKEHGIPDHFTEMMIAQLEWLQQFQQPVEPEWIEHNDELSSGRLKVKVKHTTGHAPGHIAFHSDDGVIFGGDLLLEHISTNALINFDPDTGLRNKSLLQYRKSLQWIREQKGTVFPGHGKIIKNSAAVANHHLKEHKKRFEKIQQLLRKEPLGLMEISQKIFPDAIKKGAIFLVLSEVMGYLDWGEEEKTIEGERINGNFKFKKPG
ncbi:MAG TPA: MBL fold metallo-hydrolase [Balneolaceae bacterium]|nr:MBL fold metallo-hydrolase [Balneolaceae bacterium]